jgi:hypothetical protein
LAKPGSPPFDRKNLRVVKGNKGWLRVIKPLPPGVFFPALRPLCLGGKNVFFAKRTQFSKSTIQSKPTSYENQRHFVSKNEPNFNNDLLAHPKEAG